MTAVLGPTNTGKTHYALERMLAHQSGMIGLPLRLLAREIYDRILEQKDPREVALVTGEEKIVPPNARYWVATVEAMPLERKVDFLAIDEVQLAADPERGRVFTSRILHARGRAETLFLGSDTMRPLLQRLFRDIRVLSRERFSALTYTGPKKVTRLPRRTAVVAFSADTVYAIAELIRRQRGGAAVVLGALSPRTRNAQAELYQSGEVDFLVATDAIGMGLNMDIDHVAFAARRKYDGRGPRDLFAAELAQIAGRAGRYVRDGTFGVTTDCPPFDDGLAATIQDHQFDPVKALQWRSEQIDFSSLHALIRSLDKRPPRGGFIRSQREDDEDALHRLAARKEIRDIARGGASLTTLWDVCQVPDFRKITADQHARLLGDIYLMLMQEGRISSAYLEPHVERLDRTDGDIDALSTRIAHIRTWTYLSHRAAWLDNAAYWQERARAIEDKLSDALHEKLTQRFVDRRTSTLMKRLKDDAPLLAGVTEGGEVIVEGQFVGRLLGFEFIV
ncbi:MAG: helicase-related protein, partial [Hyphococcus sp.]